MNLSEYTQKFYHNTELCNEIMYLCLDININIKSLYLLCACETDVTIVDHYLKLYIDEINIKNLFQFVCKHNNNLKIIEYLCKNYYVEIDYLNDLGENCLLLACWKNPNVEIIKFLINSVENQNVINKIIYVFDKYEYNLITGSLFNYDEIFIFLIEEVRYNMCENFVMKISLSFWYRYKLSTKNKTIKKDYFLYDLNNFYIYITNDFFNHSDSIKIHKKLSFLKNF